MSILFSNSKPLFKFIYNNKGSSYFFLLLIFLYFSLLTKSALAWSGFDYQNNTSIDIGSGNLVRENLEVTIFDWSDNTYHQVEILVMNESFNGTRLEVRDLETGKKRIFEME